MMQEMEQIIVQMATTTNGVELITDQQDTLFQEFRRLMEK